jgi:hypothetical protein
MSAELASVVFHPAIDGEVPRWVHVIKTADKAIWLNGCKMPDSAHVLIEELLLQCRTLPAHDGGIWLEYLASQHFQ